MADAVKVAVFANGELKTSGPGGAGREVVLALSFARMLVKTVRIPAESSTEALALAVSELKPLSPYPDDPLTAGIEVLREDVDGAIVLAAAVPESSLDDLAEALDAAKLTVKRIDAIELGQLRALWPQLKIVAGGRKAVAIADGPALVVVVLDGDIPVAVRTLTADGQLGREMMLTLLAAEEFGGAKQLAEIVVCGEIDAAVQAALSEYAPVRRLETPVPDPVPGIAERATEPGTLDVLPELWREELENTRFKRRMRRALTAATTIWLLLAAVLFGGPYAWEYLADRELAKSKAHAPQYRRVQEKRRQVESVRNVSNHDFGALETLRLVCSALPDDRGIELSKWNFKRGDRLSFSGFSSNADQQRVYEFKNALDALRLSAVTDDDETDGDTPFFQSVTLPRGVSTRSAKAVFDVECQFKSDRDGEEK